ncbi:FtsK/SpoIIIE domain-containing protein [Prauserella endophytica]|uniref:Cell division protein FtsK n=1 Tax=Prauserella endophytica TaxID=1592324 RepID=A0ABY2RYW6_9PSEU|nr:FtsK/SpoIIIE domain-containing protein [Prauserella endophytica]TKG66194.1 cell division protein FtsK [Prauserella endophytica]
MTAERIERDDEVGEVVPFRGATPAPADEPGEVEQAVPVLDGELIEEPQPVDTAEQAPARLRAKRVERRPVLPAWMHSTDEAKEVARWAAGHTGHVLAYHLVRVPLYAAKLVAWSPVGLVKILVAGGRWVLDTESHQVRLDAVRRSDADTYMRLDRQHGEHVKHRAIVAALVVALVTVGGVLVVLLGPGWVTALMTAGTVTALGVLGAPKDRPVTGHAVVVERYERLTSEQVERALSSLGIAAMTAKGARITFPAPIQRHGPGWRAEVDLPYGVTASDVIERRDRLSAGLRRPLGAVWPEPVSDAHAGRLVIWCGDVDMAKAKPTPWPLLKTGKPHSIFTALPFGTDQRGRPVGVDLMYSNVLIGALPGAGKTFALRVLVLGAAMDPLCQLRIYELKGSGDLDPLEAVAHHFGSGADDETAAECVASMREVYAELETRAATLKKLAKAGRAPENKVTPRLAAEVSELRPLAFVVDECQELFAHPSYGKEAARLATGIIKRGRALGVILLLATQRPDKDSLPTAISANVGIRYCLRVAGQLENDMILGTSAYRNGIRATMLRPSDKGVGWLVGAADEPQIVRGYFVDGEDAKKAVQVARLLREQAGTLTGAAVGEERHVVNVLDDVRAVFGDEPKLWTTTVLERLAQLRPEVYTGWTAEQLAAALRPFGVRPTQVWANGPDGAGSNRKGYALDALTSGEQG